MHGVSTHSSLCGAGKASRLRLQEPRQHGGKLVEVESCGSGSPADLRWLRLRPGGCVDRDDLVVRTLVIRQRVLRIAHNDVRFTVDQLSGEMYSAEFSRSILYTPKEAKVSGIVDGENRFLNGQTVKVDTGIFDVTDVNGSGAMSIGCGYFGTTTNWRKI